MLCTQTIKPAAALTRAPPTHPLELPHPTPSSSYSDAPPLQTQRHNTNSPVQCNAMAGIFEKEKGNIFSGGKCEPVLPTMIVDVFLFSSMDDLWKRRDYKVSLCIYPNASFIWWIPLPAYSEDSQYREYSDYSGHSTLSADSAESLVRKKWPANGKRPNGKIQIFAKWKNSSPDFLHHPCHTC